MPDPIWVIAIQSHSVQHLVSFQKHNNICCVNVAVPGTRRTGVINGNPIEDILRIYEVCVGAVHACLHS